MISTPPAFLGRMLHPDRHRLPLWMKLAMAGFLTVMIPAYWVHYGPSNFLWTSDVALFFAAVTLLTGHRMWACVAAVISLLPEVAWNVDFLIGLTTGTFPLTIAEYMTESDRPRFIRAISLFHVPIVPLLLYLIWRLGYDRRALRRSLLLLVVLFPATWLLTDPQEDGNINWVYGLGDDPQTWMPPVAWLGLVMATLALLVYLPTHLALDRWRGDAPDRAAVSPAPRTAVSRPSPPDVHNPV